MQKIILVFFTAILLFSCGETEESFNYIQVTVTGTVTLVQREDNVYKMDEPYAGEPVNMSLIKAGGERFQETGSTGSEGETSITTVFNLYKEQPIEFIAVPVNYPELAKSGTLTWEQADKLAYDSGQPSKLRTLSHEIWVIVGIP
ncbi:hypothetical protein ACE01N_04410 [Saccharicrinis sp. FJH2]|uniref:hypothetical protein n=1 Tax=Saccharicrinis sp. FJH65 TaxID=3344659 RepID=UPI0035F49229